MDELQERIYQVEQACASFYENDISSQMYTMEQLMLTRKQAEEWLTHLANKSDTLLLCRAILTQSKSLYAKIYAGQTLVKLISKFMATYSLEERLVLRDFLISYLAINEGMKVSDLPRGNSPSSTLLPHVLRNVLGQAWARLTKVSFWEHDSFRASYQLIADRFINPTDSNFILEDPHHGYLRETGLFLFHTLVVEMGLSHEGASYVGQHQKTVITFRDTQLMNMFVSCLSLVRFWFRKRLEVPEYYEFPGLIMMALTCIRAIMDFDFIGSTIDESSDELSSVQIPSSWRTIFEEGLSLGNSDQRSSKDRLNSDSMSLTISEPVHIIDLLFRIYHLSCQIRIELSSLCLDCIALCASIRRSLFLNELRRANFIGHLIAGMIEILQGYSVSLKNRENYEAWCRLLTKMRVSYTFSELVTDSGYQKWIMLLNDFSITSFRSLWLWSPNSLSSLLTFWSRMITSSSYTTDPLPHHLDTIVPNLCRAFMQSGWDIEIACREISVFLNEDFSKEELQDIIQDISAFYEPFGVLARYRYRIMATDITSLLDLLKGSMSTSDEYLRRVGWVIGLVTACLSCGLTHFRSEDDEDAIDGELIARIFMLLDSIESKIPPHFMTHPTVSTSAISYERNLMAFLEEARKTFSGDQLIKRSLAYQKLFEMAGLNDQDSLLDRLLQLLITRVQHYTTYSTDLMSSVLLVWFHLTCDYSTLKSMTRIESVKRLMEAHEQDEFYSSLIMKFCNPYHHVLLYQIFGQLLMLDEQEAPETEFLRFFTPFTHFSRQLSLTSGQDLEKSSTKLFITNLYSDFRGYVKVMNDTSSYTLFLNWYLSTFSDVTIRLCSYLMMDDGFSVAILHFINELAQNRSQRIKFDLLSTNGILLFRHISKIVVLYFESRFLRAGSMSRDMWVKKYKGLRLCLDVFRACLSGSYVPFAVFSLYNDPVLDQLVDVLWKMLLSTPLTDLFAYPKLTLSFVLLLETFAKDHLCRLTNVDESILIYIFASLAHALEYSVEKAVSSSACIVLDDLLTVALRSTIEKKSHFIQRFLDSHPEIVPYFLRLIFSAVIFDESSRQLGQWSFSRPLLILILLNESVSHLLIDLIHENYHEKSPYFPCRPYIMTSF